jgi:hypothetical protein
MVDTLLMPVLKSSCIYAQELEACALEERRRGVDLGENVNSLELRLSEEMQNHQQLQALMDQMRNEKKAQEVIIAEYKATTLSNQRVVCECAPHKLLTCRPILWS